MQTQRLLLIQTSQQEQIELLYLKNNLINNLFKVEGQS